MKKKLQEQNQRKKRSPNLNLSLKTKKIVIKNRLYIIK